MTGRSAALSSGVALDNSASSIEFTSIGSTEIYLNGNWYNTDNALYFTAYIDGVRQSKRIKFGSGDSSVLIASGLDSSKPHTVKLVRETEEKYGAFTARSLNLGTNGTLGEKPADKDLYIEFIGDSITCGLGSLCGYLSNDGVTVLDTQSGEGNYKCGVNSAETSLCEDATNSYAYLAAEILGADCSFVSYSGIGVAQGYPSFTMSDYYKYASKSRNAEYDFESAKKPDLVVINLGTNDKLKSADAEAFKTAVKALIDKVRAAYGTETKILWTTGLMGTAYSEYTKSVIESLNYSNVYHFADLTKGRDGHNGHPTKEQALTAANELVYYITSNNIVATTETALQKSSYVPAGYNLVWYDGFSDGSLDSSKWTQEPAMGSQDDLKVTKGANNLTVKNGSAVMSAKRESDTTYSANESLTTMNKMAFKYGYLEMRAKVPFGKPAWPSLWLKSNGTADGTLRKAEYMTEVDIFEVFASSTDLEANIHKWYPGQTTSVKANTSNKSAFTYNFSSESNAEAYHIYGMKWTPDIIEFYVEGVKYASQSLTDDFETGTRNEERISGLDDYLYILLNCYLFTPKAQEKYISWVKDNMVVSSTDSFPISYEVDYIRLFQNNSHNGGIYYGKLPSD